MNFRKRIADNSPGFQMGPMLDIIFILLIHFMAATIFAQWENKLGIQVPMTNSKIQSYRERGEVIINIDKEGVISINSQELNLERLEEILRAVHRTFKEQPVIIRADEQTHHGDVIRVLDLCSEIEIRNVAFATIHGGQSGEVEGGDHP